MPIETSGIQGPDGGVLWISNGKADDKPFDNTLFLSDGRRGDLEGAVVPDRQRAAPKNELKRWMRSGRTEAAGSSWPSASAAVR